MGRDLDTIAWRWELVFAFEREGSNYAKVAKAYNTTPRTVKTWVERYESSGDVQDKPRAGRAPVSRLFAPDVEALLKRGIRDGLDCRQLAALLYEEKEISVSRETVRLHLNAHLARQLRPKKKPKLTDSHKAKRLQFCLQWVNKDLSLVAVSDSKMFFLCHQGVGCKRWVLYEDEPPELPAYQNCTKLHAYAALTWCGKTILFFTAGTTGMKFQSKGVNAEIYVQLLQSELIPAIRELIRSHPSVQRGRQWVFQQDNAPAHTARSTKAWLAQQQGFEVMQWPPNSPDLSPIENLWGYVATQLAKRTDLTPANFRVAVTQAWANIPSRVHQTMFNSMRKRLQACIDSDGGRTKY